MILAKSSTAKPPIKVSARPLACPQFEQAELRVQQAPWVIRGVFRFIVIFEAMDLLQRALWET